MANALLRRHKKEIEKKGRSGDKLIAHLTPGEMVIPRAIAEDDDFRAVMTEVFRESGADIKEFIVGSGKNKINPETGVLEFFFHKKVARFFKKAVKTVVKLPEKAFKETKRVVGRIEAEKKRLEKRIVGIIIPSLPSPPEIIPPKILSPAQTPTRIIGQAAAAGEREGRRLRRRTGRRATRLAGPSLVPATIARAGLKTKLG